MKSNDLIIPSWPAPANVKALQTTRAGGISFAPYDNLNLGSHVKDNPIHVAQNRQLLSDYVPSEPVWLNQTHSTKIIDAAAASCEPDADASLARKKMSFVW
jgi:polyphenol oxidase